MTLHAGYSPLMESNHVKANDLTGSILFPEAHVLLWAASWSLTASIHHKDYVAGPQTAVWIPAGVRWELKNNDGTVWVTKIKKNLAPFCWQSTMVVHQSTLLVEALRYSMRRDINDQARRRIEQVIFDIIEPLGAKVFEVPIPQDPRLYRLVHDLNANPADERTAQQWGKALGLSARTLSRIISEETSLSFAQWRLHMRIRMALRLLAQGMPVAVVAKRVGYKTPSAFVAVFKKITGQTPAVYFSRLIDVEKSKA